MGASRETERVAQHDAMGQGDVVRLEWPSGAIGPPLGVIINADCDLAHGKTDGVIAFLPMYPFRDYLSKFWVAGHLQEVTLTATQTVLRLVDDTDADALCSWLLTEGPVSVGSKIATLRNLRGREAGQLNRELQRLAICLEHGTAPIAKFQQLCAVASDPNGYARTQITGAMKAMGDGHFFVSDLIDERSVGFILRMRRIYTLPEEDIFVSTSEQMSRSQGDRPTAVRIARFTELYRFKVLQLFAQQYSRIGLPDEITALSLLVVEELSAHFAGVIR